MTDLTLLYTANVAGRLDALPRMATLIRRERAQAVGPVVLLDGGSLCSPDVWPCAVTRMRAGRTLLEAMGYDAAALAGSDVLAFSDVEPLSELAGHGNLPALNASLAGVSGVHSHTVVQRGGLRVGLVADWPPPGSAGDANALRAALEKLQTEADVTVLMVLEDSQVGVGGADVVLSPPAAQAPARPPVLWVSRYALASPRGATLVEERLLPCHEALPTDPTISAVLELVVEEAERLRASKG